MSFRTGLLWLVLTLHAGAQGLTERQFIEAVLTQSPRARELRAEIAVVRAEAGSRGLYSNPSVYVAREGAGLTEFFQAEQALPITGRQRLARQAGNASITVAEADVNAGLWRLRSDARLSVHRLTSSRARESTIEQSITDLREVIRILQERERQGEGSRFDRLRAERELADVQTEIADARVAVSQALAELSGLLAIRDQVTNVTTSPDIAWSLPELTELVQQAQRARAEIIAEQRRVERYRLEQRAAQRLRYPEPVLTAGLKRGETGTSVQSGSAVALSVPLPIFNTGRAEVERFAAEQERAQARLDAINQRVRAEVEGAYRVVQIRGEALTDYNRQVGERVTELSRIAQAAYQEGELRILELLDAFRTERQARLRVNELRSALRTAQIELERTVGEEILP